MAFICYVLELQRSMQKYLVGTIDAKKEEEEAGHVRLEKQQVAAKNIKSLPWKNEVKETTNQLT